jgi:hypothetical protein
MEDRGGGGDLDCFFKLEGICLSIVLLLERNRGVPTWTGFVDAIRRKFASVKPSSL